MDLFLILVYFIQVLMILAFSVALCRVIQWYNLIFVCRIEKKSDLFLGVTMVEENRVNKFQIKHKSVIVTLYISRKLMFNSVPRVNLLVKNVRNYRGFNL